MDIIRNPMQTRIHDLMESVTAKQSEMIEMLCARFLKMNPEMMIGDVELVQENRANSIVWYFRKR